MKVLLYEYRWCDENPEINTSIQTKFQASSGSRYGEKKISVGEPISIEICSEVRCAGSRRDNEWRPCPNNVMGRKKCESCRAREGQFVFTSFDGFNTENLTADDLARIDGSHFVYLALFEKSLVKVGVSKAERQELRQIEQGSHATLFIAQTPNGILARQIETTIRKSGLADKIQSGQKKNFLLPEISLSESEVVLREVLEKHILALDSFPDLKPHLLEAPLFQGWDAFYQIEGVRDRSDKSLINLKLALSESVSGTLVARKGSFVVIETPEEFISINAKDLVGKEIEFDHKSPGIVLNQAIQNSLF